MTTHVLTQAEVEKAVRKRLPPELRRYRSIGQCDECRNGRRARAFWSHQMRNEVLNAMARHAWAVLLADPRVPEWLEAVKVFRALPKEERQNAPHPADEPEAVLREAAQEFFDAQPKSLRWFAGGPSSDATCRIAVIHWLQSGKPPMVVR